MFVLFENIRELHVKIDIVKSINQKMQRDVTCLSREE